MLRSIESDASPTVGRRQPFIDVARGIALLAMAASHVALYLADEALEPGRSVLVYITVALAAPTFLFLVGVSLTLSSVSAIERGIPNKRWLIAKAGRAVILILVGGLLNVVTTPGEPAISGDVLQTIGLVTLVLMPLLPYLGSRLLRDVLLASAVLIYIGFVIAFPVVSTRLPELPLVSRLFFDGFPPWPWISIVMIGAWVGTIWTLSTKSQKQRRLMCGLSIIAAMSMALYLVVNFPFDSLFAFVPTKDYFINGHWLPGMTTVPGVISGVLGIFAGSYVLAERRVFASGIVAALGRDALLLYVIHLLMICTVLRDLLQLRLESWFSLIGATVAIVVALIALSRLSINRTVNHWLYSSRG